MFPRGWCDKKGERVKVSLFIPPPGRQQADAANGQHGEGGGFGNLYGTSSRGQVPANNVECYKLVAAQYGIDARCTKRILNLG